MFRKYFKKRNADIKVDNLRIYGKLIEGRLKNNRKMNPKSEKRTESLINQVSVSKDKITGLIKRWDLDLNNEEMGRLESLKINTLEDAEAYADYLLQLHKKLEARHQVISLNSRLWILPITLGETILLLVMLVSVGLMFLNGL